MANEAGCGVMERMHECHDVRPASWVSGTALGSNICQGTTVQPSPWWMLQGQSLPVPVLLSSICSTVQGLACKRHTHLCGLNRRPGPRSMAEKYVVQMRFQEFLGEKDPESFGVS